MYSVIDAIHTREKSASCFIERMKRVSAISLLTLGHVHKEL